MIIFPPIYPWQERTLASFVMLPETSIYTHFLSVQMHTDSIMSIKTFIDMHRFATCLLLHLVFTSVSAAANENEFYIVFMRDQLLNERSTVEAHLNVLSSLKQSEHETTESLVYSYTKSFNGFVANLSEDEAAKLSDMDGVASVFPNRYRQLHTTRSWDFIGLTSKSKRNKEVESNIIVGILDTGITPQSESFNDDGFGPPPAKWKGSCKKAANFSGCNNKLIGAKYYKLDKQVDPEDIMSPVDAHGHGTHTSSTLAGSLVPKASVFGLGKGTARGAVPSARVAMYKICWVSSGCSDMDILAAFDDAIHDGVDVISLSVGGYTTLYTQDSISVAAFHASRKKVITVASAGNDGPSSGTVANHAPWILTVAANGIDRQFRSKVELGNGETVSGIGVSTIEPSKKSYPLVSGTDVSKPGNEGSARYCEAESMDPVKVKGKVVYCLLESRRSDSVIKGLGGEGVVLQGDEYSDTAFVYMAPTTIVDSSTGKKIEKYMNTTKKPYAVVHKSEGVKIRAPLIASFSSRGPNQGSQHLLKPDITAPGIDILAAYTPLKTLTGKEGDTLYSKFNFMSGTSMSCPHVGGAAAYVKSFHPDWTPAAIKSALMTTATPMSSEAHVDAEFAYGSGQVNPEKAISPGLVYDLDDMSYALFLCHEGYNGTDIGGLMGQGPVNCSDLLHKTGEDALNYPTMQLTLRSNKKPTVGVFRRTVTNVGDPKSVYNATIKAPDGVEITVNPMSLSFSKASEERSFSVVVKAKPMSSKVTLLSGELIWRSSDHGVRSPIVIYNKFSVSLDEGGLVETQ